MSNTILLYGAYGGIGSATARLLRARGYHLHLVGRNQDKLAALADELDAGFTVGDVNDREVFARAAADAGPVLSGLVYAIGTIKLRSLSRLTVDDFVDDFQVNALGAALAIQAVLPALKKSPERASVLLFSSVAAQQGFAMHASIGMAKGAIDGLVLALAAELAPKIRVNAIAPSLTRTDLSASLLASEPMATAIAALHPLARLGEPADIAALAAFLLSAEADWITGQIIGVDGGRSSLRSKG